MSVRRKRRCSATSRTRLQPSSNALSTARRRNVSWVARRDSYVAEHPGAVTPGAWHPALQGSLRVPESAVDVKVSPLRAGDVREDPTGVRGRTDVADIGGRAVRNDQEPQGAWSA